LTSKSCSTIIGRTLSVYFTTALSLLDMIPGPCFSVYFRKAS
jgi:hypothetical protein